MKLEKFSFKPDTGRWTVPSFPPLDSERTLVVVFGSSGLREKPRALKPLLKAYPRSHIVGCSTAGEIDQTSISDGTIVVAVAKFDAGEVCTAFAPVSSGKDSFACGESLAQSLNAPGLCGIFVLSEGLRINGSELLRGLNSVLPSSVVVTGGLAGDGSRFERTWVMCNGLPRSGIVSAVGFYGDNFRIGHGSKGGWDIFGPERVVTRSEANVLYELDGKPALQLYKDYLGERASGLPATALLFPLSLRSSGQDNKSLVRTVLAVDEKTQSMTFAGDIPQGSFAQLMKANFDRLIDGASEAASMVGANGSNGPVLALAISCVGRRLVLGERAEEEVEATLEALPKNAQQIGFYSYGEISPYVSGHCSSLHNQTMTLTTIREG